jgi:hypothetical protein
MSAPKRASKAVARQVADQLAGTPVSNEMPVIGTKNTVRPPTPRNRPTADDLAGIPISVEQMERKEPLHSRKRGQRR